MKQDKSDSVIERIEDITPPGAQFRVQILHLTEKARKERDLGGAKLVPDPPRTKR